MSRLLPVISFSLLFHPSACVSDADDDPRGPEAPGGMDDRWELVGKCSFGPGGTSGNIETGDPYVHILFDRADETYAVVMGTATVREPLRQASSLQGPQPVQPARLVRPDLLEWGDLDDAPVGGAPNWVSIWQPSDEIIISLGTIELSDLAYPYCFFRGP